MCAAEDSEHVVVGSHEKPRKARGSSPDSVRTDEKEMQPRAPVMSSGVAFYPPSEELWRMCVLTIEGVAVLACACIP